MNNNRISVWRQKFIHYWMRKPETKEELLYILKASEKQKVLDHETHTMVEGVIRYSDLKVRDIMLPRSQVITLSANASYHELLNSVKLHRHSRYPVFDIQNKNIVGILHAKDLLLTQEESSPFSMNDVLRPAIFVPESKHLNILLTEFKKTKNHMAMVVDEYGNVSGFVTIEDIIEQIVGDIEDEFDNNDAPCINKHANGRYIIKAHIPITDFNDYFNLHLPSDEYETLAGLLIKYCERLPEIDETVLIEEQSFKIISADNRRIKLVEFILKD